VSVAVIKTGPALQHFLFVADSVRKDEETMRELIKRSFRRIGIDVGNARFRRDLMDFVAARNIDLVLDVGANTGQFGSSLRAKGYRGKIISFEPISSVFETLADHARADGNWEAKHFAVGATAEQAVINVSDSTVFSSMLDANSAATRYCEAAAVSRQELIDVRTLDELFPALSGNVLLKIDTQGYERQVLEGGSDVLPRLKGILMELPIINLYDGTWKLHEALAFMSDAGFVPAQIVPVNFHSMDDVSLVEVDCLFRPRDARLD